MSGERTRVDDLTEDERAYLNSPTGRQLSRRAADEGGFLIEERAEGVLFVDRLRGLQKDLIVRKIHKLSRAGKW